MKRIRWTRRALRRLDQIGVYIENDNPGAAARVVARIVSSAGNLAEQPAMGRVGRIKGTRELVLTDIPYIIPYRVVGGEIEILTVMHAAQQWPLQL
ncbi:type II toxin-antitoxin system RelE/ParE family toxin [Mesorhizobium captivum]|uniref:type II toxin-antitoxin system RelE/ParE family toxin n=1 Tax=Mesorhizobium captivum TaxID=3072319 RepID=UPI002A2429CA|nr:type II toxin-antitoxin system RelE/ParE family toxin [Mesorhizobium sp. VK3C]MDX8444185.1 type II toxin-antitoxin system RelE/ParE family toxin [Mesorhizobium sp. VK3C]